MSIESDSSPPRNFISQHKKTDFRQKPTMNTNKILLVLITTFLYANANSQITKGYWLVGGYASFSNNTLVASNNSYTESYLTINPIIGYFISDKISFGTEFFYSLSTSTNSNSASNYGIGPFARYYFLNKEKAINILIQGSGSYNLAALSDESTTYKTISYSFLGGPVIFFNSSVGIEFLLGYKGFTQLGVRKNSFNINIGIQVHLTKDHN